eukprot:9590-Heterococcus_DN1.PRE.2
MLLYASTACLPMYFKHICTCFLTSLMIHYLLLHTCLPHYTQQNNGIQNEAGGMFLNVGNALAANRRMKAFELQPLVTADNMEQLLRATRITKAWEVTLDLFEMYMASAESLLGNGFWCEAITAITTAHIQLVTFESEDQFGAAEQLPKSVSQEILVAMGQALRERQCLEVEYSNDMADDAQLAAAAQTQAQLNTTKTRLRMLLQQQQQQQLVGMNDDDVDDDDSYRKACKLIDDVDPWDAPFWNSNRHRLPKATVSVRHTVRAVTAFDH